MDTLYVTIASMLIYLMGIAPDTAAGGVGCRRRCLQTHMADAAADPASVAYSAETLAFAAYLEDILVFVAYLVDTRVFAVCSVDIPVFADDLDRNWVGNKVPVACLEGIAACWVGIEVGWVCILVVVVCWEVVWLDHQN